jgi:micrococcal nuclease
MRAITVFLMFFLFDIQAGRPERAHPRVRAQFFCAVGPSLMEVNYGGKRVVVRLAGIITPPCEVDEFAMRADRVYGIPAKSMPARCRAALGEVTILLKKNDPVLLEFDDPRMDRQNALLCYLYLPDGRMVNEALVRGGYAFVIPSGRHSAVFEEALADAIRARRGMWSPAE